MNEQPWQIGYCTNVHAGNTLEQTRAQLLEHAVAVQQQIHPQQPLGVGLWLANSTATQILEENRVAEFARFLEEANLFPYTLNGFPHGDFHQEVVKHNVYLPTWRDSARTDYTIKLIRILDALLPDGREGSISTVPLGWGSPRWSDEQLRQGAAELHRVVDFLSGLEERTGRLIYLCLEPEPGCMLQRSQDLADFFQRYLMSRNPQGSGRYLRVCHDVCHAAVMFEGQREALRNYSAAGMKIGKVQVSSAVIVPFHEMSEEERLDAFEELSAFTEHRYLHQTMIQRDGKIPTFHEDLLPVMTATRQSSDSRSGGLAGELADQEWRIHFHVPIYLESFGHLRTSRPDILECLDALGEYPEVKHLEAETYAWNVLPPPLQHHHLADGIAAEMEWLRLKLGEVRTAT